MHDVDVVVVGAGLAGLSADRRPWRRVDRSPFWRHATASPGRNLGGFLSNGVAVEMGGQWVGPTQDAVLDLIKELGLETFPSYDDGAALTVFDGTAVRYSDESFGLPAEVAMEVGRIWEQIETLAATVTIGAPWETDGAEDLDRQTLDSWLVANSDDGIARRFSGGSYRRSSLPRRRSCRCCTSCPTSSPAPAAPCSSRPPAAHRNPA